MSVGEALERVVFVAALLGLPLIAALTYLALLVRHVAQQDRADARQRAADEALRARQQVDAERARLADPLFRFRISPPKP